MPGRGSSERDGQRGACTRARIEHRRSQPPEKVESVRKTLDRTPLHAAAPLQRRNRPPVYLLLRPSTRQRPRDDAYAACRRSMAAARTKAGSARCAQAWSVERESREERTVVCVRGRETEPRVSV